MANRKPQFGSLLDLKAELQKKKDAARQLLTQRSGTASAPSNSSSTTSTSEETSQYDRVRGLSAATKPSKKVPTFDKTNANLSHRAKRDTAKDVFVPSSVLASNSEEDEALRRSRAALERKTAIYEARCKETATKLLNNDKLEDEDEEATFGGDLINFERKVIDDMSEWRLKIQQDSEKTLEMPSVPEKTDNLVDYVDCFGRTRRVPMGMIPKLTIEDQKLTTQGLIRFNPESSEKSETDEESTEKAPEYSYQNVLGEEVRDHGVGYFSFSTDPTRRAEQMRVLAALREETRAAQKKARLERKRLAREKLVLDCKEKGLPIPPEEEEETESEQEATEEKMSLEEWASTAAIIGKLRDWDKGKTGLPAFDDGVKRTKREKMSQEEYVAERRAVRDEEFAPPQSYFAQPANSTKRMKYNTADAQQGVSGGTRKSRWDIKQDTSDPTTNNTPSDSDTIGNVISEQLSYLRHMNEKRT